MLDITTATLPGHDEPPQFVTALARANAVRLGRSRIRAAIDRGDITASKVIVVSPWEVATLPILDLLCMQHRWQRTRSKRLLTAAGVSESRPVGALTDRERRALVNALEKGPENA